MKLTISMLDGVEIKNEDIKSLEIIINTEYGANGIMNCNYINLNDRTISIDKKVFDIENQSFNIVLGGYTEKYNFIE